MTQRPSDWVLVGGEVLIGDDRVRRDLVVTGSTLAAVAPPGQAPADLPQVDAAGRLVTPGMIDTHIHGAAGVSFGAGDPTPALSWLAKHGTTTVVPSLVSGPVADMCQRADELTSQTPAPEAAAIAGVHLEGPFLSVAQCGAQDPKHLVSPAESSWQEWLPRPSVAMVTLAAERDGSEELCRALAEAGTIAALGHTEAGVADLARAVEAGLTHATHLWSGMTTFHRQGPWRVPGAIEACLAHPSITGEVIADGCHLPPELLDIARSCLGERLVVVSDGTIGIGMPDGYRYRLGDVECVVSDGVGMVVGQDAFGGSVTALDGMVRHLALRLGWPLAEVMALVSERPARLLGRTDLGVLAPGARADLVLWQADLTVSDTVLGGVLL
ncbi:N-acetylglucosamine-6-phosphate deacetylase [Parenemella sanctibonifatiensis]|uniref:N-acetylglucosamine-6-phosphate deacetylase n=1 Tax=Parenemella sanctibonifatiensis TaxID=2016505 RepID=A0A255ELF5_9ACTN|nr:amidohydrolase family protein [Parenemella sanctibonifatiensis]OYN92060.1 N-acetylglucosamine-6-phosphate deacetylase [Parenemella sanctibonifatiensis]